MAISFNDMPANWRIPGNLAEFDDSRAAQGPALLPFSGFIVGQMTDDGTADANSIVRVTSADQVAILGGRGSMVHRQAIAWFANNKGDELWVGFLADDGAANDAEGTITVSVTTAEAGTIPLKMGGEPVPVGVADGDTDAEIATAIAAAINANEDLPVTAAAVDEVVTVTAKNGGTVGNGYDMRDAYFDGEVMPEGVSLAYVQLTGGSGDPDLSTLIANLGDKWLKVFTHGYTGATELTAIEAELASRADPTRAVDAVAITSAKGALGTLTTLGDGRNSPRSTIVSQPAPAPLTPPVEHAAAVAAVVCRYGAQDMARPFQTLPLEHVVPLKDDGNLFTAEERNQLLYDGIATTRIIAGKTQIERLITTYQLNAAGSPSVSYLDLNTPLTLMYLRFSWRARLAQKYPRHKLADDGTRFGPGQAVVTPKIGRAEAVGWFRQMETLGLVEGFEQFKEDLIVERPEGLPNNLDLLMSPDLINQLRGTRTKMAFLL